MAHEAQTRESPYDNKANIANNDVIYASVFG